MFLIGIIEVAVKTPEKKHTVSVHTYLSRFKNRKEKTVWKENI